MLVTFTTFCSIDHLISYQALTKHLSYCTVFYCKFSYKLICLYQIYIFALCPMPQKYVHSSLPSVCLHLIIIIKVILMSYAHNICIAANLQLKLKSFTFSIIILLFYILVCQTVVHARIWFLILNKWIAVMGCIFKLKAKSRKLKTISIKCKLLMQINCI